MIRTAREAKLAADREQAFQNRWRGQGMTPAQLTDFAARYTAAWCSHESQRVAEFFAEQGSLTINRGAPAIGRVAIAAAAQGFMTAFPDLVVVMDSVARHRTHRVLPVDPHRHQHRAGWDRPPGAYQRLRGVDLRP